jgi:hypothetical protein
MSRSIRGRIDLAWGHWREAHKLSVRYIKKLNAYILLKFLREMVSIDSKDI